MFLVAGGGGQKIKEKSHTRYLCETIEKRIGENKYWVYLDN